MWLVHMVAWHATCGLFALCDARGWFLRYKLIRRDRVSYASVMPLVLFNQCVILLPCILAVAHLGLGLRGVAQYAWWCVALHIWLFGYAHDALFYAGHAIMHTRLGYKLFSHRVHHLSNGATAAASMYMAPQDFVFEIVVPTLVFFMFYDTSWHFDMCIAIVGSAAPSFEHSGYYVPLPWNSFDTRPHISHHQKRPHGSFSEGIFSSSMCDWLFGTAISEKERKDLTAHGRTASQ